MHSVPLERRPHPPGLWLLGIFTTWLVLQNMLLLAGFLWLQPHKVLTLVTVMRKVALVLIHG